QSTRLVTEGALEPFFFLYTDDSIQGNPETCKQSNVMLNYEVKNNRESAGSTVVSEAKEAGTDRAAAPHDQVADPCR
ncbi:MAG TPA: hypothetical protein H9747_10160, partial [Candidatus Blautia stercorigallinarum]|nr:hypothetical protein [Candidatus Blautia stercorigallinarum]